MTIGLSGKISQGPQGPKLQVVVVVVVVVVGGVYLHNRCCDVCTNSKTYK